MTYLVALALLSMFIIVFVLLIKFCIRRYNNTDFRSPAQLPPPIATTARSRVPYNPDPLHGPSYFPTYSQSPYNSSQLTHLQVVHSGALPTTMLGVSNAQHGAFNYSNGVNLTNSGPTAPQRVAIPIVLPDLPPSYIVASELLDPPPPYSEAVKPR